MAGGGEGAGRGRGREERGIGGGIAQLVQRPTEKPRRNTDSGSSPPGWQGIFLPESTSRADSLTVSVQPPCVSECINICAHVKTPKHWQPYHCLDTRKYCTHWQERIALLLRLLCFTRVGRPELPARDNAVLKTNRRNVLLGGTPQAN